MVEEQLDKIESSGYPGNPRWSLKLGATRRHSIYGMARSMTEKTGGEAFSAADFRFLRTMGPDPQAMIDRMHRMGIRLVLWQIPALKQLEKGEVLRAA